MTPETPFDKAADEYFFPEHACLEGDCPHAKQKDCLIDAARFGADYERKRAEALVEALEILECACSVKERLSGHRMDCRWPEAADALAKYRGEA